METMHKCMKCVFYSYKGGVGRTTSLMNTAHQLRKMGKSVLVIDFDFDAPGVELFDEYRKKLFEGDVNDITSFGDGIISNELRKKINERGYPLSDNPRIELKDTWRVDEKEKNWVINDEDNARFYVIEMTDKFIIEFVHKGILEFLSDTLDGGTCRCEGLYNNYIYEVRKHDEFDGPLRIMGVARPEDLGDVKLKIENRRASVMSDNLLSYMNKLIDNCYSVDYILIDSRPGREYMVAFETIGMRLGKDDLFIVCTNYNKNVVEATLEATERIICGIFNKTKQNKHDGVKIPVHPIMIQHPNILLEDKQKDELRHMEERVTKWKLFSMPEGMEKNLIKLDLERDRLIGYGVFDETNPAFKNYKKLAMRIISFNPDDIINRMENAKKGKIDEVIENFNSLKNNPSYENEYQLYFELGKVLFERGKRYKEASDEFETAYHLTKDRGGHPDIALWLGRTYYHLYSFEKKEEHINESINWFETADKIKRHPSYELYHEWSRALIERSRISEIKEDKLRLLETAEDTIESAITIRQDWEPFETKGVILTEESALTETNEEKINILKEANIALSESKIRGGKFDTHYIWARNLYDIAIMTAVPEKRTDALKRCDRLFESAVEIQEEDADVYYWWGIALALSASSKTGERRRILLVRASEKLSTAVNIRQNYKKAHFYLGAVLFMIEKDADEEQKPLYFRDAFYGTEWTVSLDEPDLSGFYFEDLQIQEFEKDTYAFVRTLENRYGYEPLFEEWVGKQDISEEYLGILDIAIKEYRKGADGEVN